jgi:hypothetical protein
LKWCFVVIKSRLNRCQRVRKRESVCICMHSSNRNRRTTKRIKQIE